MTHASFSLEAIAARSANYLERLVDARGLPYFNVFWAEPSVAAHDWPDYGDVMSRQLQGAIMLRRMTGRKVATEDVWRRLILSYIDPADGLLYRPATTWSKHEADWGDAALTLYAIVTAFADSGDPDIGRAATAMSESLLAKTRSGDRPSGAFNGFIIKSLMSCARLLGCEAALELARATVRKVFDEDPTFSKDNTFSHGGHMHGNLRTLVGAADYALFTGDAALLARVDALYRWVRSTGTRFGFLPEVIGRKGDVVLCETCALMDYAGLGVTLANHGHPEYWADMERLARNQYAESQLADASWLQGDDDRPDTEQFTWRRIGDRSLGAWAGWSSPTHFLACRETLGAHWGGPELKGKTRALQNCCGGSGVHGLFILWKNSARFEDGRLWVHLHVDKALPQAEIRCSQPWEGLAHDTSEAVVRCQGQDPRVREASGHAGDGWRYPDRCPSPGNLPGAGRQEGRGVDRGEVPAAVVGRRGDDRESRAPAVPVPGDVEGRHGRAHGAPGTRARDRVLRLRQAGGPGLLWKKRARAAVPTRAHGGRCWGAGSVGPAPGVEPEPAPLHEDDGGLDFWHALGK